MKFIHSNNCPKKGKGAVENKSSKQNNKIFGGEAIQTTECKKW